MTLLMQDKPRPALLAAAMAVVQSQQMLFDVDENGSHKLCGAFIPSGPMMALLRTAMAADKELKRLKRG
jgi:hypothetical protein